MTLNDRERFILHTMSVMVVDSMIKKFNDGEIEDIEEDNIEFVNIGEYVNVEIEE